MKKKNSGRFLPKIGIQALEVDIIGDSKMKMVANHNFFFSYESSFASFIHAQHDLQLVSWKKKGKKSPPKKVHFQLLLQEQNGYVATRQRKGNCIIDGGWSRVTPYFGSCFWWGEIAKLATTTMLCGRHILHLRKKPSSFNKTISSCSLAV